MANYSKLENLIKNSEGYSFKNIRDKDLIFGISSLYW